MKTQFFEDCETMMRTLNSVGPLPPAVVRAVATPILRRWLVDGWLNKMAKVSESLLTFPVLNTAELVEPILDSGITFFMAAGARLNGTVLQGLYVSELSCSGSPPIPLETMQTVYLPFGRFMNQKRIFYENEWYSMESILRFAANKFGGVHFDTRLDDREAKLERASRYFLMGNPTNRNGWELIENANLDGSMQMILPLEVGHNWSCIHVELLAAANSLLGLHLDGQQVLVFGSDDE